MTTSNMTFYIEEVEDGDPPPEPPPDDGSGGEGFDPSDILDLGDLTGHMMDGRAVDMCPEPPLPAVAAPAEAADNSKAESSEAAAAESASEGGFKLGALVVLRGLQAKPELNGCTGQVCGVAGSAGGPAGTGRYPVKLDVIGQGTFTFKPTNLEPRPSWCATLIEPVSAAAAAANSSGVASGGSLPEGRGGAALVVLPALEGEGAVGKDGDEAHQQLAVMIGGADRRGQHYSDAWVLSLKHGDKEPIGEWTLGAFNQSASSNRGPSARSGHSAVAFPPPRSALPSEEAEVEPAAAAAAVAADGLAGVVTVFGGSNLATQEGFGDTFQLLVGKDGSLQWRAVAVGASLPNTSSSKPRNAHAAVPLLGNNGVERATSADAASAEATSSEPKQSRADAESPIMVVIGGSTIEDGPTMDVLVLENANDASATWHQGGDPLHCSGRKPKGREMHSATVLPSSSSFSNSNSSSSDNKTNGGGVVCVCGGRLEDDTIAQDCWLLTVQSKQASATTSSSKGGKSSGSNSAASEASSSNSSWVGTWVQLASAALPSPRCGHVAVWWPSRFSAHSEADEELQATSSSFSHGSGGSLVLFGGTDGAGLPKGLLVLEESPASSSGGKKDEKAKDMYWRAEALPLEGRLSAAAGATLMRRGERDGNALLVFGGVTAAADSADSYLIEPPN